MPGRKYQIKNLGAATRTGPKTVLQVTAAAGLPVDILHSSIESMDNPTSFQLRAVWKKITTVNGGAADQGTTTIVPLEEDDTAPSFTAIGDLSAEPTTYSTTRVLAEHAQPSVIGWEQAEAKDGPVHIRAGETWGLYIATPATYGATKWLVSALAVEMPR